MDAAVQPTVLQDNGFAYAVEEDWGVLPDGWRLGDVAAVAVDAHDQVYLFNRGEHPMIVLNREGAFLRSWGEGVFTRPHGLHIGPDGAIYCTDDGDDTVRKFDPDGRLLLQIGVPGQRAPFMSNRPFCRCTHTALSPQGDIYVADGYGNACVHKFAPDGTHLKTWGECGVGPGQFNLPHNILCGADGRVYVADRENHRVQIFDDEGRYLDEWRGIHRPCAICMAQGPDPLFYVGEIGPVLGLTLAYPNLGPRVSVLDSAGKVLARLGDAIAGQQTGRFIAPHGIAVDSTGSLYVGEVAYTAWPITFPGKLQPETLRVLRKLKRIKA